jgi:tRNA uridine 5-carboxymethylaminomethyl modification enzyme
MRLTEKGRQLGLVDDARWAAFSRKREAIERETARLRATWAQPRDVSASTATEVLGQPLEREHSLFELLRRPGVDYQGVIKLAGQRPQVDAAVAEQVEISAKYAGYIERQKEEVETLAAQENVELPANLDYTTLRGLSKEVQQKLNQARPQTIGQASRIQGVTPAAVSLLLVYMKRERKRA